jgi:hypothetical protein
MTPPRGSDGQPNPRAPLSQWYQYGSYDSARECYNGWAAALRMSEGAPEWQVQELAGAKWIATDDPRLKGK